MFRQLRPTIVCLGMLAIVSLDGMSFGQDRPELPGGINENFRNPDVEQYVGRFETESREVFAQRHKVVQAIGLNPGMSIADIGAGTGLFTMLFAEKVQPEGKVYAVDIAPNFLAFIDKRAAEAKLGEVVETVRGTQTTTNLAPNSIDVAYICDTYHHFEHPGQTLASIHQALRPEGRLVIVEFDRREGISSEFILDHVRADKKTFLLEIQAAGFEPLEVNDSLEFEENFFAVLRKVSQPADRQQSGTRGGEGDNY